MEVRSLDPTTPTPDGRTYARGGDTIVPVRPLDAPTTYSLDVGFADGVRHATAFTTGGAPLRDPELRLGTITVAGSRIEVRPSSAAASTLRLSAIGPGGSSVTFSRSGDLFSTTAPLAGVYEVCAAAGGLGSGYTEQRACASVEVRTTAKSPGRGGEPSAQRRVQRVRLCGSAPGGSR